jgi:antitoxin (DNA-binding transcriptional repressor) of toxin-antitoxin stability system
MERSIGAFEAKSQLSRLLRAVEHGEHFTITVRGKPVAESIEAMQALSLIRGVLDADVASFVAEGRR